MATIRADQRAVGTGHEVTAMLPTPILRRISWGAVIGGVVIAISVQMLLSMLGLGIGMTTIDPMTNGSPAASSLGIGAAVWWVVSSLLAMLAGAFVAARLSGVSERRDGMLHGLLTWGAVLLLSIYLLTSAVGGVVGGTFNLLGRAASGTANAVASAVPAAADATGLSAEQIEQRVDELLQPANGPANPDAARRQLIGTLRQVVTGDANVDQAKQQAAQIVAQQAGISQDDALNRINEVQQQAQQLRQQAEDAAKQAADKAAAATAHASLWTALALVIAAVAAALGGAWGTREELVVTRY